MSAVTLFLCGDVMTGRGIDQILGTPSAPALHEGFVESALGYVLIAEQRHGPIPRRVSGAYIWGDGLAELRRFKPHARVINLETAVTTSEDWQAKGINYRMHPGNVDCLRAAGIDCCTLANNHVLDWGVAGLRETLQTLQAAGIAVTGAGADAVSARAPAAVALPSGRRLLVFGCCTGSSGVPAHWAAAADRPGVNYLADLRPGTAARIAETIRVARRDGDLVVVSVHWGANWDFAIGHDERAFARALVDEAGVDIVHGHSSHHVKGIEVHRGRLILYGCGDLINDYEGIGADPAYRGDLGLMYFPVLAQDGVLRELTMTPVRMRRFRLERAPAQDAGWLADTLNDAGERLGTQVARREDGRLALRRAGPNRLSP